MKPIHLISALLIVLSVSSCGTNNDTVFGFSGPAKGEKLKPVVIATQPQDVAGIVPIGVLAHGEH